MTEWMKKKVIAEYECSKIVATDKRGAIKLLLDNLDEMPKNEAMNENVRMEVFHSCIMIAKLAMDIGYFGMAMYHNQCAKIAIENSFNNDLALYGRMEAVDKALTESGRRMGYVEYKHNEGGTCSIKHTLSHVDMVFAAQVREQVALLNPKNSAVVFFTQTEDGKAVTIDFV